MVRLGEDATEFGVTFKRWRKAAQKACGLFRQDDEGAEAFMRKWHDVESCRAADRHAKAVAAPPTVDTITRRGGVWGGRGEGVGGGGGLLLQRQKSGSSHYRLDVCVPPYGRKKLA